MPSRQHQQALTGVVCSHCSPSAMSRLQPAVLQTQATVVALQTLCKLRHCSAARICRIDGNTSPKQNESSLPCGEEYILFEISLVAVATTKKGLKNRLIVCVCKIAKSDYCICHVSLSIRPSIRLAVRTEILGSKLNRFS